MTKAQRAAKIEGLLMLLADIDRDYTPCGCLCGEQHMKMIRDWIEEIIQSISKV
jgi:hypothetical protein|tara:strand:+ start:1428 stop:1589 length:162 start_codon:yes stop_codon:yes gene_type:complete